MTFAEARKQLSTCDCYRWDRCGKCIEAVDILNAWFMRDPKPKGFYDGV